MSIIFVMQGKCIFEIFQGLLWELLIHKVLPGFKMHLSPPVASAAVRSKAVDLLLLTLLIVTPIVGSL